MTRTLRTPERRAVDDYELGVRMETRAIAKADKLEADAAEARREAARASARRRFKALDPDLPQDLKDASAQLDADAAETDDNLPPPALTGVVNPPEPADFMSRPVPTGADAALGDAEPATPPPTPTRARSNRRRA